MFLTAMLESIRNIVDNIIVADGAYQAYYDHLIKVDETVKPWSTDGSLEIIQMFPGLPSTLIIHPPDRKPWINQNLKRTALLNAVPEGDWFIILDADEMLQGNVKEGLQAIFESGCIAGRVPKYHCGLDQDRLHTFDHPRIFQKIEAMHYHGNHWHLRDKFGRVIEEAYPLKWTPAFVIAHFKAFKPVEKLTVHQNYMSMMSDRGWLEPSETEQR